MAGEGGLRRAMAALDLNVSKNQRRLWADLRNPTIKRPSLDAARGGRPAEKVRAAFDENMRFPPGKIIFLTDVSEGRLRL
jgi:hypothetical protein